MTYGDILINY